MESMSYSSNSSFAPQSYIPFPSNNNHTLMAPSRSFSPEFHHVDSPTYSFASSSSASRIQDEKYAPLYAPSMYNTLDKQEILSPLPDSFYDAYQAGAGGGMPLLTPPADPFYYPSTTHPQQEYRALPPPPPAAAPSVDYPIDYYFDSNASSPMPCYTPGCQCQLPTPPATTTQSPPQQPSFYSMPSAGFYDPSPYARHSTSTAGSKRQYKSRSSIDSTLSHEKSANTPRRYKCTLCIKRFTRPSSLATHMHSHTGEKPYKCVVDGCGRRFSVVSNLRRHAKIHSGAAP